MQVRLPVRATEAERSGAVHDLATSMSILQDSDLLMVHNFLDEKEKSVGQRLHSAGRPHL